VADSIKALESVHPNGMDTRAKQGKKNTWIKGKNGER